MCQLAETLMLSYDCTPSKKPPRPPYTEKQSDFRWAELHSDIAIGMVTGCNQKIVGFNMLSV